MGLGSRIFNLLPDNILCQARGCVFLAAIISSCSCHIIRLFHRSSHYKCFEKLLAVKNSYCMSCVKHNSPRLQIDKMDFFQTREKYRRQEMRHSMSFLFKFAVIALVAWMGWLWGTAEQKRLQADSNLAIFESDREIQNLNQMVERLRSELTEAKAQAAASRLTDASSGKVAKLVKAQIANGTKIEQIYAALQSIGVPANCRVMEETIVAVATDTFVGEESRIFLFDGALRLNIEGEVNETGSKTQPWFDPAKPISIRQSYLGGQNITKEILPISIILPAEEWIVEMQFSEAELRGYVDLRVRNCVIN